MLHFLLGFVRVRGILARSFLVRNWCGPLDRYCELRSLDEADRQAVGLDLMRIQYRWPVGMPLCRALGDGLWEVRTSLPSNRIARVLFSVQQGRILVLHGFIKKTQKTPPDDLALARRRNREFEK
ncbi:type II toxin-antitoxin system RelE/ParE family toxin [Bradyrhizobium huanghuaihaiense]|uniref:type II toxin-antitoxin system RelE/ParE family toxin n=1 Tax=Bradyrhizobium huanghuaihaiense TaxID=990078 RepID=UPI0021AA28CC|nr:type II toxin-antitoxin system RelE/ParE family toxin [Bradyrhizobium sp. CB3035]UWU75717.1 type II toxin-antitoxin system RelE/ParE family toxin [Bradyrhizobium sp. CB3035]